MGFAQGYQDFNFPVPMTSLLLSVNIILLTTSKKRLNLDFVYLQRDHIYIKA